jgi:hypothetical protein
MIYEIVQPDGMDALLLALARAVRHAQLCPNRRPFR